MPPYISSWPLLLLCVVVILIVVAVVGYLVGCQDQATSSEAIQPSCQVPIYGQSPFPPPGPPLAGVEPTKLIISTDVDFDDIMALIFLVKVPQVNILGIVVSGNGMVPLPEGLVIVQRVLQLAGREDIPVIVGSSENIDLGGLTPTVIHRFPAVWREGTTASLMALTEAGMTPNLAPPVEISPVDFIVREVQAHPEEVTILTLGALTDLAKVIQQAPNLGAQLKRVVIMGGAISGHQGNITDVPGHEFNLWLDPIALQVVTNSGWPLEFVTLNATDDVPITPDLAQLARQSVDDQALRLVVSGSIDALVALNPGETVHFWDDLAALIAISSPGSLYRNTNWVMTPVTATLSGQIQLGCPNPDATNYKVYIAANALWFYRDFYSVLFGVDLTTPNIMANVATTSPG